MYALITQPESSNFATVKSMHESENDAKDALVRAADNLRKTFPDAKVMFSIVEQPVTTHPGDRIFTG